MKKYLFVFILFVAAFVAVIGTNQMAPKSVLATEFNDYDSFNQGLSVTATGIINVQPDLATINFSIETKNKILSEAQIENSKRMQNLIVALKEQGINDNNIKTTGFYIYPEYDYNYGQKFTGYKISNQISVTTKIINNAGKIIDTATNCGITMLNGIQFSVEDSTSAYNNALEKAVELAKGKAVILSQTAEMDNLKIISIKELSNSFGGHERFSYAKTFDNVSQTHLMHGEIEVSATVQIWFQS